MIHAFRVGHVYRTFLFIAKRDLERTQSWHYFLVVTCFCVLCTTKAWSSYSATPAGQLFTFMMQFSTRTRSSIFLSGTNRLPPMRLMVMRDQRASQAWC